ncbi:hypothetical protein [Cytobacillus sp. IB215316]|uniref:hypothetical protein n=1 Tax=Cytobacillus sp. IB215316 TaxID=3097354 RepID=UPI002A0FF6CB|nr:hypothetical protein [Cytobacillus sp. IB215316]MDX8363373.1 hypothetical protein [Cytobacillus sp. IB215316]
MNQNTNFVLDKITFAYNKHKLRKYKESVKKIKTLDLSQYLGHKKIKFYAESLNSSSIAWGVL